MVVALAIVACVPGVDLSRGEPAIPVAPEPGVTRPPADAAPAVGSHAAAQGVEGGAPSVRTNPDGTHALSDDAAGRRVVEWGFGPFSAAEQYLARGGVRIETLGSITISPYGTELLRVSPGGHLLLEEVRDSVTRRLVARAGLDGSVVHEYSVDGHPVRWDSRRYGGGWLGPYVRALLRIADSGAGELGTGKAAYHEALANCHAQVGRAVLPVQPDIPDSARIMIRGDTVFVAGIARWSADGSAVEGRWTCDLVREAGQWRQWHFGVEPLRRIGAGASRF